MAITPTTGTMSLDQFKDRIRDTKVRCAIPGCSFRDHSIVSHLLEVHNLSVGQYKQRMGDHVTVASPVVLELLKRMERSIQSSEELEQHLTTFVFREDDVLASFLEVAKNLPPIDPALRAGDASLFPTVDKSFSFTSMAKSIVYGLSCGKNVFIEGPTGCGKTAEVVQVVARMKRAIRRVNMNGDVTTANFLGSMKASPTTGTYFKYGSLPFCMKHGIPMLADEIDYMPPPIAAVLNPVLEGGRQLYIPDTDESITAVTGFTIVATANTGGKGDMNGQYTGTEVLNTAFLDRFPVKELAKYLTPPVEESMLVNRFKNATAAEIKSMVKFANDVRSGFLSGNLSVTLSTRKLIDYFEMRPVFGAEESLNKAIMNWLTDPADYAAVYEIGRKLGLSMTKRS